MPAHIKSSTRQPDDLAFVTESFVTVAQNVGLSTSDLESSLGDLEMFLSPALRVRALIHKLNVMTFNGFVYEIMLGPNANVWAGEALL